MEYKDISGRVVSPGDIVCVLNSINLLKKVAHNMSSLVIGVITDIDGPYCDVKIGNTYERFDNNEVSKINLKDSIDDVIIHIAHNIENLQLKNESEIIDNMLNPLED